MFASLTIPVREILAVTETVATKCWGVIFLGHLVQYLQFHLTKYNTKPGHSRWSFAHSDKQ